MTERLAKARRITVRAATAAAWVFAVGSLLLLALLTWLRWPGTDSVSHIMAVSVEGSTIAGPGFRYAGVPGTVLLIGEGALVLAGIVLSILPRPALRRTGLVILVLWAGLWLGNAVYVARLGGFLWWLLATLLGCLFLCTVLRAVRAWRRPEPPPPDPVVT